MIIVEAQMAHVILWHFLCEMISGATVGGWGRRRQVINTTAMLSTSCKILTIITQLQAVQVADQRQQIIVQTGIQQRVDR